MQVPENIKEEELSEEICLRWWKVSCIFTWAVLRVYVYQCLCFFTTCPHGSLKIEGTTGSKILSGIILTVTCYALRLPERRTTYLWGFGSRQIHSFAPEHSIISERKKLSSICRKTFDFWMTWMNTSYLFQHQKLGIWKLCVLFNFSLKEKLFAFRA